MSAVADMTNSDFLAAVYGELLADEYGWVCTFRASPDSGDWSGRPYHGAATQARLIDSAASDNTYFSVAILTGFNESGKYARTKSCFARLAALVVDDVNPADVVQMSWALQTSPGKFQVGIMLDETDPDAADIDLVNGVMGALASRGKLGFNDQSGNGAVRYVRLPIGTNTKSRAAGPWSHQMETWNPQVRWTLADACAAFDVDLDAIRHAVSLGVKKERIKGDGSAAAEAITTLAAPLQERSYHDSLVRMAASHIANGMFPGAVVDALYSMMDLVKPAGPPEEIERWRVRRDEIPRIVKSAEKFAPEERKPATITINLHKQTEEIEQRGLQPLDWTVLDQQEPEPEEFLIEGWLPRRTTTLFSANGGVGKSNVSLQIAASIATGAAWFGIPTIQGKVLVISAEDDTKTVHFRMTNICKSTGVELTDLHSRVFLYDMTQEDCIVWRDGGATEVMQWLSDAAHRHEADLVIIDNSSDVFCANENDRAQVRGFMRCLNMIAKARNCAVLLLAHVDKASVRFKSGIDTDSTFSGSTAWNNSARSRWAMFREKKDIVRLKHEKSNHGDIQESVDLEFDRQEKIFKLYGTSKSAMAERAADNWKHELEVLRAIDKATKSGETLRPSRAAHGIWQKLEGMEPIARMGKAEFFDSLYRLQQKHMVEKATARISRRDVEIVVVSDFGKTKLAMGGDK